MAGALACAHAAPEPQAQFESGFKAGYGLMEQGPERADPYLVGVLQGVITWSEDQVMRAKEQEIRAIIDEARAEREEKVRRPRAGSEDSLPDEDLTK